MEIIDFVIHCFWLLIGFYIGSLIFNALHKKTLPKEEVATLKLKLIPIIKTETINGIIYAFDVLDDKFISQGATLEEVAQVAYKYKKIGTALVTYENQNFWFVNGKTTPVNAKVI